MEDYLKKAIKEGIAINVEEEPEKAREILERNLGFMRDGLPEGWVDEQIDTMLYSVRMEEVMYYDDIELSCSTVMAKWLPSYLRNIIEKFKREMKDLTN